MLGDGAVTILSSETERQTWGHWEQRTNCSCERACAVGSVLTETVNGGVRRRAHLLLQERVLADAVAGTTEVSGWS